MHVTQILAIVLWGASEFQGPTQVTRVNRLASWWYSSRGRGGRSTRVKPIQLAVAGFGILRIPTLDRMISNAYVQLPVGIGSVGKAVRYVHTNMLIYSVSFKPTSGNQIQSILLS